jgi:hypothetical protein
MFDELKKAIRNGDKEKAHELLGEMEQAIIEGNAEIMTEVTSPSEITELHNLLTEHLGVPPRTMMVKGRVTTRRSRAILFCRAMKSGVARVM